jgi:hypothetical protein
MTVVECAKMIMEKNWKSIEEIDIKTLGQALMIVDTVKKNSK